MQNRTLLDDSDDESDKAAADDAIQNEMFSHVENYFCDIPS